MDNWHVLLFIHKNKIMIYHKGISGIVFIGEKHKHIDIFITCAIQHSSVLYKEKVQDRDIFYDNFNALNLWLCRCGPCNCFPHLFCINPLCLAGQWCLQMMWCELRDRWVIGLVYYRTWDIVWTLFSDTDKLSIPSSLDPTFINPFHCRENTTYDF